MVCQVSPQLKALYIGTTCSHRETHCSQVVCLDAAAQAPKSFLPSNLRNLGVAILLVSHQQHGPEFSHRLVLRHINCICEVITADPLHCFLASPRSLQGPGTEWISQSRSCMVASQCDRWLAPSGSREGSGKGSQEGCDRGGPTAGRVEQLRMSLEQQLGPSRLLEAHRYPLSLSHLPFPASHYAH